MVVGRRFLAVAVLLGARAASADVPGDVGVDVFVAGRTDAAPRLKAAVGIADRSIRWVPIARVDVVDVLNPRPESVPAVARVWIDCSRPDRVRLYFANWNSERFLVRDVPLEAGLNEIALETVAQMISSSLSALISDERAGMSRAEMTSVLEPRPASMSEPRAAERPSGPTSSPWRVALGAFYSIQAFAPEAVIEQGPGIILELGPNRGRWSWAGWASVQYDLPEIVETNLIGARLDTIALRGGVALARAVTERIDLEGLVGGGADAVHVAPRFGSGGESASLSPDRLFWAPAARLSVGVTARAASQLVLSTGLLVDAYPDLRHYDVSVGGTVARVATPWRVRPGVTAGLAWP